MEAQHETTGNQRIVIVDLETECVNSLKKP